MRNPTRRVLSGCCARVANGHAAVAPPSNDMNSRRLMCCPQSEDCTLPHGGRKYCVVHHSKFARRLAAMGHFEPQAHSAATHFAAGWLRKLTQAGDDGGECLFRSQRVVSARQAKMLPHIEQR